MTEILGALFEILLAHFKRRVSRNKVESFNMAAVALTSGRDDIYNRLA